MRRSSWSASAARAEESGVLNEHVVDAKQVMARLKYQQSVSARIEEARKTNDIEGMKRALVEAQTLGR